MTKNQIFEKSKYFMIFKLNYTPNSFSKKKDLPASFPKKLNEIFYQSEMLNF